MVYIPKRVVEVFFFSFFHFLFFSFWFWFFLSRYSRGAWCSFFLGGVGLGWGWGSLYNIGESFALDWTTLQVHVTFFFIDEMGGRDGRVWAGGRRQDAFC